MPHSFSRSDTSAEAAPSAWTRDLARCEQRLHEAARPELEAMVRVSQTADHMLHGRWQEAESLLGRFPSLAFGGSLWGLEARRLGTLYTCRQGQGRVAELLDELIEMGEHPLMTPIRPVAVLAALEAGKPESAGELVERWGVELREDWSADFLYAVWGLVAARLGRTERAREHNRAAVEIHRRLGLTYWEERSRARGAG